MRTRTKALFLAVDLVVLLVFLIPLINAAGGGGGEQQQQSPSSSSGGESKGGGRIFSEVACNDDGSIRFFMPQQQSIVSINKEKNTSINVPGSWSIEDIFTSDEGIFTAGAYTITDENNITRVFTCPAIKRVCKWIQLTQASCIQNASGMLASVTLINDTETATLKFNFKSGNKVLAYTPQEKAVELKDLVVTIFGTTVTLSLNRSLSADIFEVVHTACLGKRYLYAQAPCTSSQLSPSVSVSQTSERLKCGGLLDIHDRVRCRVNLESGFNDYENFYPEECKTRTDGVACYALYKSVSHCWEKPTSNERITCLKTALESDKKQSPKEKILTLTKLRLYNLEEQAEMLEERGLLTKEDLITFVVAIELKKKELNAATTNTERKKVVQDARALWKELMKKVQSGVRP